MTHFTATNETPPPISHGPFQSAGCQYARV